MGTKLFCDFCKDKEINPLWEECANLTSTEKSMSIMAKGEMPKTSFQQINRLLCSDCLAKVKKALE